MIWQKQMKDFKKVLWLSSLVTSVFYWSGVSAHGKEIIDQQEFCRRAMAISAHIWPGVEIPQRGVRINQLLDQIERSHWALYLPAVHAHPSATFLNVSRFFAKMINAKQLIVVHDLNDLRFLPFTMEGSELLIIVDSSNQKDLERSKVHRLIPVAQGRSVAIHQLHVGAIAGDFWSSLATETKGTILHFPKLFLGKRCSLAAFPRLVRQKHHNRELKKNFRVR